MKEQFNDLKWEGIPNKCKSFRLGDEPEVIHIIKTGFRDKYIVVDEDAFDINTGNVAFYTKKEIEEKYFIFI